MSLTRVTRPAESDLTMMSANCSGSVRRPRACTFNWNAECWGMGGWPSTPAEICTFWACSAATTSPAVRSRAATLPGSSQMRIE